MRGVVLSSFFTLTGLFLAGAAGAQPVSNLPLTCPSAGAIGQPQNNCSGIVYQSPSNDQLIVLRANATWARAADLASSDTLAICTLPVEPGTYSSCRDASGVRRIAYVAKSTVISGTTPPPPPPPPPPTTGARIIDLSRPPVEITAPGVYVFNQDWSASGNLANGAIVISADDVTLDLQGFHLTASSPGTGIGIGSNGSNVIIKNGRVSFAASGSAIRTSRQTRIERVTASVDRGTAVVLGGFGSLLTDSVVRNANGGTAVLAEDDTIIRNSRIHSDNWALRLASGTTVENNDISVCAFDPCITVEGSNNIIRGNKIRMVSIASGLLIRGNQNIALDNILIGCDRSPAIIVEGQGNTLRENLVPRCDSGVRGTGIEFRRDGNFYGDNTMWAMVPFNLGATVQTDLGGNVGITQ